jgi:phosphoenolpyruvate carboxykinase (ATP)
MTIASGQESKLRLVLAVNTGEYTGRSPLDRFIVKTVFLKTKVWWGKVNIPFEPAFEALYKK